MKRNVSGFFVLMLLLSALLTVPAASRSLEFSAPWKMPDQDRPALDVPYVPTPQDVVNEMLDLAEVSSRDILYDLGCGDGRIVVTAAKERRVRKAIGVDLDPVRIEQSNRKAQEAGVGKLARFLQKDLFEVDLSDATVVSLYLLPGVNLKLRPKLLRELKPGTRIVSHDFNMGDWQPDRESRLREHSVFLWIVPASVNGTWKWTYTEGQRLHACDLRIRQHFQTVYKADLNVDGIEAPVTDIRLRGNKLEFTVQQGLSGMSGPVRLRGTVRGDRMTGETRSGENGSGAKTEWTAQRKPGKSRPVDASSSDKIRTRSPDPKNISR